LPIVAVFFLTYFSIGALQLSGSPFLASSISLKLLPYLYNKANHKKLFYSANHQKALVTFHFSTYFEGSYCVFDNIIFLNKFMLHSRLLHVSNKKSFFLFGPRQVGKSTYIQTTLELNEPQLRSYDLLHTDQFHRFSVEPHLLRIRMKVREHSEWKVR